MAFEVSMSIYNLSKGFPREEMYSLTDQIRRSSRSVCTNIAEAWRKRRYPLVFRNKLSDAEAEAAETQTWLEYCLACSYLTAEQMKPLDQRYDQILAMLVTMSQQADKWNPENNNS